MKRLEWIQIGHDIPDHATFQGKTRVRETDEVIDTNPMGADYKYVEEALYEYSLQAGVPSPKAPSTDEGREELIEAAKGLINETKGLIRAHSVALSEDFGNSNVEAVYTRIRRLETVINHLQKSPEPETEKNDQWPGFI